MINRNLIIKVVAFGAVALNAYSLYRASLEEKPNVEIQVNSLNEKMWLLLIDGLKFIPFIPFHYMSYRFLDQTLSRVLQYLSTLRRDDIISLFRPRSHFNNYTNVLRALNMSRANAEVLEFHNEMDRFMRNPNIQAALENLSLANTMVVRNFVVRNLQNTQTTMPSQNNSALNDFSVPMKRYMEKFTDRKNNCSQLQLLNVPDKEVEKFIDFITQYVANRPVRLDGRLYDLDTLLKIPATHPGNGREDPMTKDIFYLRDIQAANNIQQKIESVINKYSDKELKRADRIAQLGLQFFKNNNYFEAEQSLKTAIELHSKIKSKSERLALYHYNLGSTYNHLNNSYGAIHHYSICAKMRTDLFGPSNEATKRALAKIKQLDDKLFEMTLKIAM